jgi:dienelactone hydrolase
MRRIVAAASLVALVVFLLGTIQLGRLERGGPSHTEVALPDGIPGTLYVPWGEGDRSAFLDPRPRGERPPAVLLVHGFSSDRMGMSSLARRLAGSGYAVLAIDLQGHGENRTPFRRSRATPDSFRRDLVAAVDYLRRTPLVDGSRIVVMGHSMGAGACLDYATRDSGIDAAVLIAGGWTLFGPYRPPDALFIYAEGDPDRIKLRATQLAARVAGVEDIELGRVYGEFTKGTAVSLVEVPGVDHASIVWSAEAAATIIEWLDASLGIEREAWTVPDDPRLALAGVLALAFLLVLPGLGFVAGALVPAGLELPDAGRAGGLLMLAAALAVTMPLLAVGTPGRIVSGEVADIIVTHLALAGIVLMVILSLRSGIRLAPLLRGAWPALPGAAVAMIGIFVLAQPLGVVTHRLTLTPERMLVFGLCVAALTPFTLAFQLLLRRGATLDATLFAVVGRVLVLLGLAVGVRVEILPSVVLLMLPALAFVFIVGEVMAAALYAASRNLVVIALVDAAWLALVLVAITPIRI